MDCSKMTAFSDVNLKIRTATNSCEQLQFSISDCATIVYD